MGKRKSRVGELIENLEVIDAAAEGKAVARKDELVVFVNGAVPGDVVDVKITLHKRRFLEGTPVKFHKHSSFKTEPFCEHFGTCGGCKWQHMIYSEQIRYKQKQVKDNFDRIGHLTYPEISPILGSEITRYYRNKLEFTFSDKCWLTTEQIKDPEFKTTPALGYHIPGRFDKILQIHNCHLQPEPSNSIRNFVYNYAIENNLRFYNLREQHGLLRNMIVRNSLSGDLMLIMIFGENDENEINSLLNSIKNKFPQITSLQYVINTKKNDTIHDLEVIPFHGDLFIIEKMEDLQFIVGPKSFYQTNSTQAYELYKLTREFASLTGNETVYDLYTGTGTIACFIASKAGKVVGIEYVEDAVKDAKVNAEKNGIKNVSFFAGDMKDILNEKFIAANGKPDVIITDPPRAGMHADVVQTILSASPERIVYVSCNPATQARDLALMKEDYRITKVQPVDMFPHTHHVENIVLLEKV